MSDMIEKRRFSYFYLLIIGLFLGFAVSSWLGPKYLAWYFNPPVELGINCTPAAEWGMSKLIRVQVIGMLLGGFGLWLVAYFMVRRRVKE